MTETQNLAQEHLDSLLSRMRENVDNGNPLGQDDEGEELTAWDWLEDVLDIRYLLDSELNYMGAELLLSYGGPTVRLDTWTGKLTANWELTAEGHAPRELCDALNEAVEELFVLKRYENRRLDKSI